MEKNIYSRVLDFLQKQSVDQATKENLRKVLSADQFARQYPSVGRRFAGMLGDLVGKGKDFVGGIKITPKTVTPIVKTGSKFLSKAAPVFDATVGTGFDVSDGMSPAQALTRNIVGTVGGVIAYPFAEAAVPVVPGSGLAGYFAVNQGLKAGVDKAFDVFGGKASAGDPITGGFLGGPLPNVGESNVPSMEESLAKYGFNDNFELQPRNDGTFGVVQSEKALDESAYQDFLNRTRNSPAMQSGAFDPRDLFETYKSNQQFQADRKSGKLKKDRMAGERVRITMPMDME
tara:strand:+ start:61 stop:924 length:864 start_codon:yes stop_codon:yes gene_type:complete